MDKTYNISLNNITKGAAIKIGTVTYRILSLAKDGTAEIFPLTRYGGTFPLWPLDTSLFQNFTIYRESNNEEFHSRALPFSTTIGPEWEAELSDKVPFNNYLQTAGTSQTIWTRWKAKNVDTGTTVTIKGRTGEIPTNVTFYKTSVSVAQSSGTFHWRVLSLEDIIEYFDSYTITATQLFTFLGGSNSDYPLAELGVYSGSVSYGEWYGWFVDKGYYGLSTTLVNNATPVYKLNLTEYKNWTIAQ